MCAAYAQQNESNQRNTGYAVGFKTVSTRANGVAGVVTGAVCDHARVAGVIFLDLENDLHQIGADIGDLGEDAAGDTESGRAQRFTNGKADETGAGIIARNKEQNTEHDEQLNADQHHADAHARLKGNGINGIRLAFKAGERRARVGKGVHANTEPRHAIAARDPHQAEEQNDDDAVQRQMLQNAKVENDDHGNESFKYQDELALRDQIGLAGLIDQLRDFTHGAMHGRILQLHIDDQPEQATQSAEDQADFQQRG